MTLRMGGAWRSAEAQALIESKISWPFALFVMSVEFVAPSGPMVGLRQRLMPNRGYYRMRVQAHLRSDNVRALLKKHRLLKMTMFKDEKAQERADEMKALGEKRIATTSVSTTMWFSPWVFAPSVWAQILSDRVVHVTLKRLLDGVEILGTMEEIQSCHKALVGSVDRAHGQLLFALGFDNNDVSIISPGKPPKAGKPRGAGAKIRAHPGIAFGDER